MRGFYAAVFHFGPFQHYSLRYARWLRPGPAGGEASMYHIVFDLNEITFDLLLCNVLAHFPCGLPGVADPRRCFAFRAVSPL